MGGVVYNGGFLSIDNSKFSSNKASDAAAIYSFSNLIISNCEFQKNTIGHSYGVIYVSRGNANISNSLFKSNKGSDEGCCIFTAKKSNVIVERCEFIQNTAYSYTGAIDNNGNMIIDNCSFDKNSAWGAGAIDNGGTLTVLNSNFTRNSVTKNGGAIDTKGKMQVVNCTFDSNTAGNEGGAIIFRGDANVSKSSFMNNHAGVADAIYINEVKYSLVDNWWGSDYPDYSKLFNINVTENSAEDAPEPEVNESNSTNDNVSGNQSVNNTDGPVNGSDDSIDGGDVPVNGSDDSIDGGDVPVNGSDGSANQNDDIISNNKNKAEYKKSIANLAPISTNDRNNLEISYVKIGNYKRFAEFESLNGVIPRLSHIKNLNVKANVSKISNDIKLSLMIKGMKYFSLTYSNGTLSFKISNYAHMLNLKSYQGFIDRLIEKFNLDSLDIILKF